jgi:hypothetical protein
LDRPRFGRVENAKQRMDKRKRLLATEKQRRDTKNRDPSIPACQQHTPLVAERDLKGYEQF